ncbi:MULTISPECIES: TIR domain-containing protein, partial [unclassified Frankia]|uniref:toll/interleukin-1 receptor domain-containing protein n=1 Tax=unclassified Frankia TaxID=2632575 RepID=UPI0027DC83DE
MVASGGAPETEGWDFFVSYTARDRAWAEWVAWQLEDAGHRVLIQAWDFVAGSNWQFRMDEGVRRAERTIAILSAAYLTSVYGRQEWQAAQAADPNGFARKLLPVRVEDCLRPGLLGGVVSIDLFGRDPRDAHRYLLSQISGSVTGRAKPTTAPTFPVPVRDAPPVHEPAYPEATPPAPAPSAADPGPIGEPLTGHTNGVRSVAFTANGRNLATGSRDRTVRLWDVTNPARPRAIGQPLTGHTDAVVSVAFTANGRTLATGSYDRTVRLWDVTNPARPQPIGQPRAGRNGALRSVAFTANGRTLATGSNDKTVRLWDVTNPARPQPIGRHLTGHTGGVWSVAFTANGHTLATGST